VPAVRPWGMRILFGQGTPVPLKHALREHEVRTAYEMGWSSLDNGSLLEAAEKAFALLVTIDRNVRYQQNMAGRQLAILGLPPNRLDAIRVFASGRVSLRVSCYRCHEI